MDGSEADARIDYPSLMREALAGVVRRVLERAAERGLPGEHHVYLTFGTADDGVELSAALRQQYPDEMTIVLQHQFWNLAVDDTGFSVTLRFGGRPERLVVPWPALRAFADPSVDFGFRLQPSPAQAGEAAGAPSERKAPAPAPRASGEDPGAATDEKVVDFGRFRRRPPADPEA